MHQNAQVGVFAQLATVEDRRLAEVLSAAYMGAMQARAFFDVYFFIFYCLFGSMYFLRGGYSGC